MRAQRGLRDEALSNLSLTSRQRWLTSTLALALATTLGCDDPRPVPMQSPEAKRYLGLAKDSEVAEERERGRIAALSMATLRINMSLLIDQSGGYGRDVHVVSFRTMAQQSHCPDQQSGCCPKCRGFLDADYETIATPRGEGVRRNGYTYVIWQDEGAARPNEAGSTEAILSRANWMICASPDEYGKTGTTGVVMRSDGTAFTTDSKEWWRARVPRSPEMLARATAATVETPDGLWVRLKYLE